MRTALRNCLIIVAACSSARGQSPNAPRDLYNIRTWTTASGLPQGTITDIAQTEGRELWIATFGGLLRFDGVRFRTFDLESHEGLPSNRFTALALDGEGGVWTATQYGELLHFRSGEDEPDRSISLGKVEAMSLERDSTGVLWVRSSDGAIRRAFEGDVRVIVGPNRTGFSEDLLARPGGGVFAAMKTELVEFDASGERIGSLAMPFYVLALARAKDGSLWLGLDRGLACVRDGAVERVECDPPFQERVSVLRSDGADGWWLGTLQGPRHLVRGSTPGSWQVLETPLDVPRPFPVRSIAVDHEGDVWFGSEGQGLVCATPHRLGAITDVSGPKALTSIADDGEGGAWISFECSGIAHVRASEGIVARFAPPVRDDDTNCVKALLNDRLGRLWVALGHRVARFERGEFHALTSASSFKEMVVALVQTADGRVWAAETRERVVAFDSADAVVEELRLAGSIVSMFAAEDGALWIGGAGEVWCLRDGKLEHFGRENGLPRGDVRAILPEADDSAWLATYGNGLVRLSGGRAVIVTTTRGLTDPMLSGVLDDGMGRLWLPSNRGLIVVERQELLEACASSNKSIRTVVLGPELGMPEANFGAPAGLRDVSGRLWFGTIDGVVPVDPRGFPFRREPPRVRIERVSADDAAVARRDDGVLAIPAGTRRVAFEYTAFEFSAPQRVAFRYRLDGFDETWNDAGSARAASFTALPPGDYVFRVEACNEFGLWSDQTSAVALHVAPSWWQTLWFQIGAAVFVVGTMLGLHRLRVSSIRRRAATLLAATEGRAKAEERESRLRDDLAHVARVATAGELATSLAHEVNQPLAAIVANALAAQRSIGNAGFPQEELATILNEIAREGRRASEVIRRLRGFLGKHSAERRTLDLNQVVRETLPLVRRELDDHRVTLALDLAGDLPPVNADPVQLQQVLVNLIKNACEAMDGVHGLRRIEVASRAADGGTVISVRDTGPGLAPEIRGRLFEPHVTTKANGMGLGLAICRSIVEAHGGRLSAEPALGGGLVFRIDLPRTTAEATPA